MRPLYLRGRAAARAFVARHPAVDLAVGRTLVRFDLLLRRAGLASVMDADATELTFDGLRFTFDRDNHDLAETITATGTYEEATTEVIRALPPGAGFVDLGANIGLFTVLAARAVGPAGRVFAFEPTPSTAALLRRNVAANGVGAQVTVVEQAVSDAPGTARFSVFRGAGQANQLELAGTAETHETITVPVTSLDAYFAAQGWPRIDLVKMDIEGAELPAFRGMRELVRRNPSLRLIFEYNLGQLRNAAISGASLIAAVTALGLPHFTVLFRNATPISLPADQPHLDRLATRSNLNLLASRA